MAEGGTDTVGGARAEINLFCQPCLDDRQELKAHGYCMDCEEHLCEDCFNGHTKPRPMRLHKLLNATEMPKVKITTESKTEEKEKCSVHKECYITSLCMDHDLFCCDKCRSTGHRSCKDVKPISELAENFEKSETFKGFSSKLNRTVKMYKENKEQCERNIKTINKCHDDAIETFTKYVDVLKERDMNKVGDVMKTCETVISDVESWKTSIEQEMEKKCREKLFVRVHGYLKHLDMIQENSAAITEANTVSEYRFEVDEDGTGMVVFGGKARLVKQVEYQKEPRMIEAITFQNKNERNECYVTDMVLAGRDHLIIANGRNKSLKVIDVKNKNISATVQLQNCPWEIAKSDHGEIFVSFQRTRNTVRRFHKPLTDLTDAIDIKVHGKCDGIRCVGNTLLIQSDDPNKLIQTDFDGKLLKTIHHNVDFVHDITFCHSAYNPLTKTFLLTNYGRHGIAEITMDGEIDVKYTSEYFKGLGGVVVDTNGALFVCNERRMCVTRITADGDIRDIITDLSFQPLSLALDTESRRLYVGGSQYDKIRVYAI